MTVDGEEMTRSSACGCSWADPSALCRGLQAVVLAGPDLSRTLLGSSFHSQACSLLALGLSLLPAFFPLGAGAPGWCGEAGLLPEHQKPEWKKHASSTFGSL